MDPKWNWRFWCIFLCSICLFDQNLQITSYFRLKTISLQWLHAWNNLNETETSTQPSWSLFNWVGKAGFVPADPLTGRHICFRAFALSFLSAGNCRYFTVPLAALSSSSVVCSDYSCFSSIQFSRSVVSDSLWPHEPQHTRPPCPSLTPRVHPNPCPSSQWHHPTISSSYSYLGRTIFIIFQLFLSIWERYVAGLPPAPAGNQNL